MVGFLKVPGTIVTAESKLENNGKVMILLNQNNTLFIIKNDTAGDFFPSFTEGFELNLTCFILIYFAL